MTKQEAKDAFGKMVRSESRLIRRHLGDGNLVWSREKIQTKGLLVGTRTLINGKRYFDSTYGWEFYPKEYISIALIVPNWRQNPVPVPLEDCELVTFTLNEKL